MHTQHKEASNHSRHRTFGFISMHGEMRIVVGWTDCQEGLV